MRLLVLCLALLVGAATNPRADPADRCASVRNDDTVRPYDPRLRPGFVRAYKLLFPGSHGTPSDTMLATQASFRCMDGRLVACFVGANLPCAKLATARDNPGADAFCRDNPEADVVPMAATGHDTPYAYRCRQGHAQIDGTTFEIDARGFGASLWAPMD